MTFYDDVICKSPYFASTNRVSDLGLLEPVTRAAVEAIMRDASAAGMPLLCFETYRSAERQYALFLRGATQLAKVGVHHYGLAADLVKDIDGQPSWKGDFSILGRLAARHGLVWGGLWTGFPDLCHVQRVIVADQPRLFAGWYPENDYSGVVA